MSDDDKFVVKSIIAGILGVVFLIIGCWWGFGSFNRWNGVQNATNEAHVARIHAANQTQVNELLISANAQQVKIHEQQAQIRVADAEGIREAQDKISKTLTPLYVQLQMVDALKEMALSGKNNTLEMIPSGAGGIPLVADVNPNKVTAPTP